MNRAERIVVVGTGVAALRAAERLRELGFCGEIMMIGAERHWPYHRPALCKQLLVGGVPSDVRLAAYGVLDVVWRLGTTVRALNPKRRVVELPGGEEVRYDGLVIATGVEAKRLAGIPHGDPRVTVMRTLPDALALQRGIATGRGPVVVIGGGFTGCEIASSMRELNREVTVVARSAPLLGAALGQELGKRLTDVHRSRGVDVAFGATVQHWSSQVDGLGVYLSTGKVINASCVVVAAGSVPCVSWLRGSGLVLEDGVLCDPGCHVIGAEDVVAAGDVARWPNLRFDTTPRRVEHWINAVEMGRAAAENLLAGKQDARPFTPVPRFWSEQHGLRIQAAGIPKLGTDTVMLSPPVGGHRGVTGHVREGRLMGVVGVNNPAAVLAWTKELEKQAPATKPTQNVDVRRRQKQ
ncbi:NAD(P)/FAD-dependent oxidoreductase [Allokutzneria oryzae]|uniref:NAD(P)/FAD-dependent oxidoreductase n=1 Tax=Allokutzneria oryzae TaxID=1378989 RepID=A0ABV6A250_9PSEU